jgi:hypothetical protein
MELYNNLKTNIYNLAVNNSITNLFFKNNTDTTNSHNTIDNNDTTDINDTTNNNTTNNNDTTNTSYISSKIDSSIKLSNKKYKILFRNGGRFSSKINVYYGSVPIEWENKSYIKFYDEWDKMYITYDTYDTKTEITQNEYSKYHKWINLIMYEINKNKTKDNLYNKNKTKDNLYHDRLNDIENYDKIIDTFTDY